MPTRYAIWFRPDHPLAGKTGLVLAHRVVLFDAIGPGSHTCRWCDRTVNWVVRGRAGTRRRDELHVDHVDTDTHNNALDNLVPSCHACNITRPGGNPRMVADHEPFVVKDGKGTRLRAVKLACKRCGTEFDRAPANIRANDNFCSRSCADKYRSETATVCKHGHPRDSQNVNQWGQCITCQAANLARYREKKRRVKSV